MAHAYQSTMWPPPTTPWAHSGEANTSISTKFGFLWPSGICSTQPNYLFSRYRGKDRVIASKNGCMWRTVVAQVIRSSHENCWMRQSTSVLQYLSTLFRDSKAYAGTSSPLCGNVTHTMCLFAPSDPSGLHKIIEMADDWKAGINALTTHVDAYRAGHVSIQRLNTCGK